MIKVKKDLTGKKFGRLLVINQNENDYVSPCGRRAALWNCICDCGNEYIANGWYLTKGDTNSCGCLQKEFVGNRGHEQLSKYNTYDLSGDYGIGYTEEGDEFWFDVEDYDLIKNYYWSYGTNGYLVSRKDKKQISFHRLVMGMIDCKRPIIDHIVHSHAHEHKIDNRKSNLRIVTDSQNSMNQGIRINNTTGTTGVYRRDNGKWQAAIGINNKQIYLGTYDLYDDAVAARKEAEKKYFGEYSYDASQMKGE